MSSFIDEGSYWILMLRLALILLMLLSQACSQQGGETDSDEVIPFISKTPLVQDWQEVLAIEQTHIFGVEGPIDHPEAWIRIVGLKPGPKGTVLVLDWEANRVCALDPEHGVVTQYGYGSGSGPGELMTPSSMAWVPGVGILVHSRPLQRITVFNEEGRYLRDIHPDRRIYDIESAGADRIWIQPLNSSAVDRVFLADIESGEIIEEIGGRHSGQPWNDKLMLGCRIASTGDGLLVSTQYPYEVMRCDNSGRLLSVIGREVKWLDPPGPRDWGPQSSNWDVTTGMVGRAILFPNGVVMVELNRMIRNRISSSGFPLFERQTWYDFFTPEGEWLTTIPADILFGDQSHGAYTVTNDGAFWAMVVADYHQVARFVIQFKWTFK